MTDRCPRCGGHLEWKQGIRDGKQVNWTECRDCQWKSIVEQPTYPPAVALKSWAVYILIGAILWTLIGMVVIFISVHSYTSLLQLGARQWLVFFASLFLFGSVVGHLLNYLLAVGQRNQSVFLILVLPRVLFAVAGGFLGLALGYLDTLGWPSEISLRSSWLRVTVGLVIGYIVVGPTIRTARSIRIGLGLR